MNLNDTPNHVETLIIGGGIVGAGIFRDLALHGHQVLLVDKHDFCAETSSKSSKMLHGGIRYLENFEFHLVYEALHEKNLWAHLTPHLCKESPFLIPVFKDSLRPLWMIRAGLFLYDLLSGFSNHYHNILGRKETQKILPGLKSDGLKGAGVYYDCIVDDTKLGLEVIYDGLQEPKAQALNYVEITNLATLPGSEIIQATLRDTLTQTFKQVTADQVVVAVGPFTDIFMNKILGPAWTPCLLPNKGSHLWFKKEALPIHAALVIQDKKGRIIFVIPHNDRILVGTTEVLAEQPFESLTPSPEEINYLINLLQDYFPHGNFGASSLLSSFAGVRPLVRDDNSRDLSKTAREHKLYFPMHNLCVIAGGKYTTFRKMAEDVARWAQHRENRPYLSGLTTNPLRQRGTILPWQNNTFNQEILQHIIETERPRTPEDVLHRRIGAYNADEWNLLFTSGPSFLDACTLLKNQFDR
ncbi:MAG: hypothetical protein A2X86_15060 [Bdellovibrionales bacterium GWA2_49_15]|nr:MAG: hypothetical protein A2X86_15060 [Bdellovibrionales bacterium GWA2_49_15]